MCSLTWETRKQFVRGIELKRPQNVGKYDAVLCGQYTLIDGPTIRKRCEKVMNIMKVIDSGLQIRGKTLECEGWHGHMVQSHQMYIAVCHGERHILGKPHVVCSVCIENYSVYVERGDPYYAVVKDYYEYKPKKK